MQSLITKDISKAVNLLKEGKVISIPTETVYGLAGNALDESVVLEIFQIKNRPSFDPLIVHLPFREAALKYATDIPVKAQMLMEAYWPGPLTLVLSKKSIIPDLVTSGMNTVALRVPAHPFTLELLQQLDFPLAAPSANPFGYISPTTAQHVKDQLGNKIELILDGGPCSVGIESTIIGFENDDCVIYRPGVITDADIRKITGDLKIPGQKKKISAPGMLDSHYAPRIPMVLGNIDELVKIYSSKKTGILSFKTNYKNFDGPIRILSDSGDLREAAQNLFTSMRFLDNQPIDLILAEPVPYDGLGIAINDRLKRASSERI